jgi:hypothetical protein
MWQWLKDTVPPYATPKVVKIRDWRLGVVALLMRFLVFLYIVVYTILYNNRHLLATDIVGTARMTVQQPTRNGCNPLKPNCYSNYTAMIKLPYCDQYGKDNEISRDLAKIGMQHHCRYWDGTMFTKSYPMPGYFWAPSRVSQFKQDRGCRPSEENGWTCHDAQLYQTARHEDKGPAEKSFYIADFERFTILIDHSFFNPQTGKEGTSQHFKGFLDVAGVDDHIEVPDHPHSNEILPETFKIDQGFVASIGDLLRMADRRGADLLDVPYEYDGERQTRRWNGGVLRISVFYSNNRKWSPLGLGSISYTMKAEVMPNLEYKQQFVDERSKLENSGFRVVHDHHGFLIGVHVHGELSIFSFAYLLQVLTASLGMLAGITLAIDFMMTNVFPLREKLSLLKTQVSADMCKAEQIHQLKKTHYNHLSAQILDEAAKIMHKNIKEETKVDPLPDPHELVYLLMKTEQRLNRLDGLDEGNVRYIKGEHQDGTIPWIVKEEEAKWAESHNAYDPTDSSALLRKFTAKSNPLLATNQP